MNRGSELKRDTLIATGYELLVFRRELNILTESHYITKSIVIIPTIIASSIDIPIEMPQAIEWNDDLHIGT